MKRKIGFLALIACILAVLFPSTKAYAATEVDVTINDVAVWFDQSTGTPFIDNNGRTQVPLRAAMEAMGAVVGWNNYERAASISKDGITVIVPIGKKYVYVNGVKEMNDTAAQIVNNRTYLPIRIVAESLGAEVSWINDTKTVDIQIATTVNDWPYNGDLSQYIGKPIASVYTLFGYNCTEDWPGPINGPTLVFEQYNLWFGLAMYGPNINCDNPKTYHHPNNEIFSVISAGYYPIFDNMYGCMTLREMRYYVSGSIYVHYDSGEESEAGCHSWVEFTATDYQTGEVYSLEYIWENIYPSEDTPASYAILRKA